MFFFYREGVDEGGAVHGPIKLIAIQQMAALSEKQVYVHPAEDGGQAMSFDEGLWLPLSDALMIYLGEVEVDEDDDTVSSQVMNARSSSASSVTG